MDLDGLLDRGGPEQPVEHRGWTALKILVLTFAVTAVGGAVLVFFLYLASIGAFTAWLEFWDGGR